MRVRDRAANSVHEIRARRVGSALSVWHLSSSSPAMFLDICSGIHFAGVRFYRHFEFRVNVVIVPADVVG